MSAAGEGQESPTFDDLLVECADLLDAEGEAAVDALCGRHPTQAAALRQALATLTAYGLVGPGPTADPQQIGGYRVLRRLGDGAFGVVYLCAQVEPIRREVAIKVLRPGAGDRTTLLRFDAERQLLAMLSHPSVAQVFDAGALPDGRPYFVMEYVDGQPITTYCDAHRLDIEARLALFLELCDGVHAAHQRGIIHRDLKPSNVLVGDQHGRPVPKIIDFGLAKALHTRPAEAPLLTEAGGVVGTPGFMSPEQASGDHQDVDIRTDVFALGVILYLLLTGEMPWRRSDKDATATPPRPSARVASEIDTPKTTAALRSTETRQLVSRLRGDLDWIVLRALDPDRDRRYASVLELAADLRRHRRHEPVLAGPPSLAYQIRKFVRRHRVPVFAGITVLVTLVVGLATTWTFAVQAQTNLERFEILAIGSRLRTAKDAAASLYPAWPQRLPAFDAWLAEHARPLGSELPRLRAALADARARAQPLTDADREDDRRTNPWTAEQRHQQARLAYLDSLLAHPTVAQDSLAALRNTLTSTRAQTLADLQAATRRADERRTWRFADEGQQFLHDNLTQLLLDVAAFAEGQDALAVQVQRRRDAIVTEMHAAEARTAAWDQVARDVAAEPRYGELRLTPQAQLVPVGKDPRSGLQEFYHVASAPEDAPVPARDADGVLQLGVDDGVVFVLVPGGRTWLGAQRQDPGAACYDPEASMTESPVHQVTLAPFFLAKHELTQAQWQRLTGKKPSALHEKATVVGGASITRRHPVESVDWEDCKRGLEQHGLDLPTEAQWEHACRAGTTTTWPSGDDRARLVGFAHVADPLDEGANRPTRHEPVGSHAPNAWGLHDMVGNVAEWCRDYFSSLAYLLPPTGDDGARPVPQLQQRPVRGGSFQDPPAEGSSAARNAKPFNHRGDWLGMRAARRIEPAR